ncbi:MAG: hypothetical protein WC569_05340 [Candidatus Omnitrophota bacterium]
MKKAVLAILFLIFAAGCSNVHVGGSGSVGGVSGSGGVSIPLPQR